MVWRLNARKSWISKKILKFTIYALETWTLSTQCQKSFFAVIGRTDKPWFKFRSPQYLDLPLSSLVAKACQKNRWCSSRQDRLLGLDSSQFRGIRYCLATKCQTTMAGGRSNRWLNDEKKKY